MMCVHLEYNINTVYLSAIICRFASHSEVAERCIADVSFTLLFYSGGQLSTNPSVAENRLDFQKLQQNSKMKDSFVVFCFV